MDEVRRQTAARTAGPSSVLAPGPAGGRGGQPVSIGIAEWNDTESGEDTVARADAALHEAKGDGRARPVRARA